MEEIIKKYIESYVEKYIEAYVEKFMYYFLEYNCNSSLTDEDMLKLHIDIALENGNKDEFMKLSQQFRTVSNA